MMGYLAQYWPIWAGFAVCMCVVWFLFRKGAGE